jgi:hypothetical protein
MTRLITKRGAIFANIFLIVYSSKKYQKQYYYYESYHIILIKNNISIKKSKKIKKIK